ncbi:MAG: hypothetical protein QNJ74_16455 [Trichodesmium sp. MO_231.B1]|nr:hypothetical protein [Trichodesmium sp. MO_231.B1]
MSKIDSEDKYCRSSTKNVGTNGHSPLQRFYLNRAIAPITDL